ncbi:hypothetical protein H0H87_010640 [Tephrocybe sp. NHM501043]|nr:hypothetical protein H0H87_010640 [Tephrocybe sp. NHM501043]
MFSTRNTVILFCLGVFVFYTFQISILENYYRLQTTIATALVDGTFVTDPKANRIHTLRIASKIYVLSLPDRTDRRQDMEFCRGTLGLRWTYIDAIDSRNAIVERIINSVRLIRDTRALNSPFTWPDQLVSMNEKIDLFDPEFLVPLTSHATKQVSSTPLVCATQNDTIVPYEPTLADHKLLTAARVACWYSHMVIIHTVANDFTLHVDDAVIVFEDDVDMERDIQERLRSVWHFLPTDWDIVYLGAKS